MSEPRNKSTRKPTHGLILEEIDRSALPPVKTGVILSAEAHYRLRTACTHLGRDQSAVVQSLVMEHLGGFFTSVRARGSEASEAAT